MTPIFTGLKFGFGGSAEITPGTSLGGGYFAGQINDGGTIYNLIVAPVATGQTNAQYKTTSTASLPAATYQNEVYGKPTNDVDSSATYPAFQFARSLSIGGFTDWYIPAKNEMDIIYYNLKPSIDSNSTADGINPNAVPARTSNFTTTVPGQTTSTLFQTGGSEAFTTANYWTSSEDSGNTNQAWRKFMQDARNQGTNKTTIYLVRAIRRVAA
jgi:hypothetical protein